MSRFKNSWSLLKSSLAILKADKHLAVIPVISAVCSIVVIAVVGAGIYLTVMGEDTSAVGDTSASNEFTAQPLTYVVGAIGYLILTFVVTFFTAVLVSGAYARLTGKDSSLGSAFSSAVSRLPQILAWSLLTGTVGLILQALRERFGFVGDIIIRLIGAAWEIVTWLAIPVIVVEETGPIVSLKRSAKLFAATWGENLIAQAGFGLAGMVLMLPGIIVGVLISVVLPIVGIPLLILYIVGVSILLSTLSGIYRTALYLFASTGQAPTFYDQQIMENAFHPKKSRI